MPIPITPVRPREQTARSIDRSIYNATNRNDGFRSRPPFNFRFPQQNARVSETPDAHSTPVRMTKHCARFEFTSRQSSGGLRRITRQLLPNRSYEASALLNLRHMNER